MSQQEEFHRARIEALEKELQKANAKLTHATGLIKELHDYLEAFEGEKELLESISSHTEARRLKNQMNLDEILNGVNLPVN